MSDGQAAGAIAPRVEADLVWACRSMIVESLGHSGSKTVRSRLGALAKSVGWRIPGAGRPETPVQKKTPVRSN